MAFSFLVFRRLMIVGVLCFYFCESKIGEGDTLMFRATHILVDREIVFFDQGSDVP